MQSGLLARTMNECEPDCKIQAAQKNLINRKCWVSSEGFAIPDKPPNLP